MPSLVGNEKDRVSRDEATKRIYERTYEVSASLPQLTHFLVHIHT